MTQPQRNSALVAAIVCGLLSLPMTWFTVTNVRLPNEFEGAPAYLSGFALQVTGLNGSFSFPVSTPIWFVVLFAISANVLQLLKNTAQFEIPHAAKSITAVVSAIWITFPVLTAFLSGDATPGIGWMLGVACALTPVYILIKSPATDAGGTSDDNVSDE